MDRPNVVIVADTFRRDHLGAYGNPFIRAPHLDSLARSSVVFANHLISSFPTMPARADILTGIFSYTPVLAVEHRGLRANGRETRGEQGAP